jgi:adenosylhomocysteine nucleosidase
MSILYVMAVELEYGAELRRRIAPVICGVGPVEAAVAVAAELARRQAAGDLPQLVVSLGSAGSRTLAQTEVYQARTVAYRDMDASALGFARGVTPFLDLPAELVPGPRLDGVPQARLATGASVVSGADYGRLDADMVDMETYAILRACQRFAVPLIALRGISDGAEELRTITDWTQSLGIIDAKLAALVDRIERDLAAGRLG